MEFYIGDIIRFKGRTDMVKHGDFTYKDIKEFEEIYKKGYSWQGKITFLNGKNEAEIVEIVNNRYFCSYVDENKHKMTLSFSEDKLELLYSHKNIDLKVVDEFIDNLEQLL